MSDIKNIKCPNCDHKFDVEDVLATKVRDDIEKEYKEKQKDLLRKVDNQKKELEEERAVFAKKKKQENEIFKEKLKKALKEEKEELKEKIKEDYSTQLKAQQEEIEEKRQKLKELREKEIQIERMKRQMEDQEKEIEVKFEKKLREHLSEKEQSIEKRLHEKMELRMMEKDKQLEDQNKLIEELKRKKDQGSMQLQGEVQELAIEDTLRSNFPFDFIEEVPKGVRGADSIQTVINPLQQVCGKIIFESKRTKAFSNEWLDKLKADQRSTQSELAVLITQTLPKDIDTFGQMEGVWVCSFQDFLPLVSVLRQMILKTHSVKASQENKGDKMDILYRYLTGEEFKQQVTAIVEGFSTMKLDLDKEKRSMMSIWKKREKQIEKVIENTINMHASIKGIAGNSIANLEILELGGVEEPLSE